MRAAYGVSPGRSRVQDEIHQMMVRMAGENRDWINPRARTFQLIQKNCLPLRPPHGVPFKEHCRYDYFPEASNRRTSYAVIITSRPFSRTATFASLLLMSRVLVADARTSTSGEEVVALNNWVPGPK